MAAAARRTSAKAAYIFNFLFIWWENLSLQTGDVNRFNMKNCTKKISKSDPAQKSGHAAKNDPWW
jgi:hypothetical protein